MKMVNANNSNDFLNSFLKNKPTKAPSKTFKEERADAEKAAVAHSESRKIQASKYGNAVVSEETHPGFRDAVTDESMVVEKTCKALKVTISELVGKGGFELDPQEFRTLEGHKDKINDSKITDKALVSFACKFSIPTNSKYRVAHFVVSYDLNSNKNCKVEDVFYTEGGKEVALTRDSLSTYINTENAEVKVTQASKPIAYFDSENGIYETIETKEDSTKIAARLQSLGYEVDSNFWVDACHNTQKFGKLCYFIKVPMEKVAEFKKVAAWSDEEWFNRADEKHSSFPYSGKGLDNTGWTDRSLEKGTGEGGSYGKYKADDFSDPLAWRDRALPKPEDKSNPYAGKGLATDSVKKDEGKEVKAEKKEASVLDKVKELESLLE